MRNILVTVLLAAASISASARSRKISSDVPARNTGAVDVIVQFKHVPSTAHAAKITSRGGRLTSDLSVVKALHVSMPANRLQDLAGDPEVTYISPNRPLVSKLNNAAVGVLAT